MDAPHRMSYEEDYLGVLDDECKRDLALEAARDRVVEAALAWADDYERSELLGHPMELAIFDALLALNALTAKAKEGA